MTTKKQTGEDTSDVTGENPEESKDQQPPQWFQSFAATITERLDKVDGRFTTVGQDLARIRKRASPASESPKPESGGAGDGQAQPVDMVALLKLGESMSRLPEQGRAHVEKMLEQGRAPAEIAETASLMLKIREEVKPETGDRPQPPPSQGATPGKNKPTPEHPKTQDEYRKLIEKDPRARERLLKDPSFDPFSLR